MHIGRIDESAVLGSSWLHRVSPVSKLVAFAFLLAAVITSWNALLLASLAIMLATIAISARLDGRLIIPLAGYPALFAIIFAFSASTSLLGGATVVLKAVVAALGAIIVILTTPYPSVFAPIQRIVPAIVGDALLMTYRSLFLLFEKFGNLITAARLRAGLRFGHPLRSARMTTRALAGLLVYSFDLSQRSYDIMRVRGYEGRLYVTLAKSSAPHADVALIAGAAIAFATSVFWRVQWQALNPYSWILALLSAAGLAVALMMKGRHA
ncbi:MAG: energy-coupling factor transporter transmembrane component T [Coriobacteriia bacterium]|jgi:energy-coupling factor transporter transmembrane protein EcfT|nr:energy-coupling factor transporter transmembrane component T [Coriobacteriia bacterium]